VSDLVTALTALTALIQQTTTDPDEPVGVEVFDIDDG
jgi:hypothetical protein